MPMSAAESSRTTLRQLQQAHTGVGRERENDGARAAAGRVEVVAHESTLT
jgi:hypothetical protein